MYLYAYVIVQAYVYSYKRGKKREMEKDGDTVSRINRGGSNMIEFPELKYPRLV